ncbi:MAG TPA: E3 binding domain-containing protein [Rubrobacter sp.]|nr:E3 binding domain-containing protein [Rubrobacter sp.]
MDPTDLWRQWYETSTRLWSEAARGVPGGVDPAGFYRRWFEGAREMQGRMIGAAPAAVDGAPGVQDMWQRWSEASTASWQKGAELGQNAVDLLPRWTQMLEEARDNLLAGGNLPADPLQFATRWYNATSGPFSDFVGDVIEREEFLEPSSQFLQSYAGFYKVFKRNSEEYLKSLQFPVRSDISRVAGLVINLEDKIDRIEEVLEDFEYTPAKPATADSIEALEERIGGIERALERLRRAGRQNSTAESVQTLDGRLDGVESKLDRLLAALESQNQNGDASAITPAQSNGPTVEIRATDAARRKAQELDVTLAEVEGTGFNGEITVGDVRRKGDS